MHPAMQGAQPLPSGGTADAATFFKETPNTRGHAENPKTTDASHPPSSVNLTIEMRAAERKIEKAMQRKAKFKRTEAPTPAKPQTEDGPATKKRRVYDEYEDDAASVPARKEGIAGDGTPSRFKVNPRFNRNIRNMWSLVGSSHDTELDIRGRPQHARPRSFHQRQSGRFLPVPAIGAHCAMLKRAVRSPPWESPIRAEFTTWLSNACLAARPGPKCVRCSYQRIGQTKSYIYESGHCRGHGQRNQPVSHNRHQQPRCQRIRPGRCRKPLCIDCATEEQSHGVFCGQSV